MSTKRRSGRTRSYLSARTRVLTSAGIAGLTFFVQPGSLPLELRILIAWSMGVAWFLGAALWMMLRTDAEETRRHCLQQDDSWAVFDLLLLGASVASLAGVLAALIEANRAQGLLAVAPTGTSLLAVALSWSLMHTLYALRYARLYYRDDGVGGIDFHGDGAPDYQDFLYVAVTIGVTFGVSDSDLTSHKMRRAVTKHSLLSFLFGTVIIALSLNVITGLLSPKSG